MSQVSNLRHIANWLRQLQQLCAPGKEPVNRDKLATYAIYLQEHFPLGAFTQSSLHMVAENNEYFPAMAVLRKHLHDWWQQHRPPPPPDPRPRIAQASEEERQAANRASWDNPAAIRGSVAKVLSSPLHQLRLGKLLARCVAVNAPQHMHHVPPEWHLTDEEMLEAHATPWNGGVAA